MSKDGKVALSRIVNSYADRLLPGERAMLYATDVAGCECGPHSFHGIPCTVVGTSSSRNAMAGRGTDRCLVCGVAWVHRLRRADPLVYELSGVARSDEQEAA